MTVALAEGLLDASNLVSSANPDQIMPWVARRFVEWAFGPDNNRAPGNTCMAGCYALRAGKPWTESGVPTGDGCGSAMRSSPVGLAFKEPDVIERMARASSVVTHAAQSALDAAHAAALGVRALLEGTNPDELPGILIDVCAKDDRFYALMSEVETYVDAAIKTPGLIDKHLSRAGLGEAWKGDSAVASALYCFLLAYRRGEGYVETVRYGANTCGDSDSIAAIAGSFAGAYWGLGGEKGVPADWIDCVEDRDELELLAQRLYALHQDIEG
jgi:ADP-ribosylglycohydrolase